MVKLEISWQNLRLTALGGCGGPREMIVQMLASTA